MNDVGCGHRHDRKASPAEVAAELGRAETLCRAQGQRWTEPRRRVYELLLAADAPVKAYDLMDAYAEGRSAKPPTVYRALEFLEERGFVHRIASLNAFTACGVHEGAHAASFLICQCCGSAEEFAPTVDAEIAAASRDRGFRPQSATLEVRGLCRNCAD